MGVARNKTALVLNDVVMSGVRETHPRQKPDKEARLRGTRFMCKSRWLFCPSNKDMEFEIKHRN